MQFIKRIWPILVIGTIVVLIFALNYKPDTILTGWDNLHPEFDFGINIKRSIFAVWQEYQGLGLLGGMGHASDLPRQIFLLMLSVFMPIELLRYSWTFLMLFSGGVGTYCLIRFLDRPKIFALLGSLFYILNLSTIQSFYVPFEVFTAHFGFLPWLILTVINYFQNKNNKSLILFVLVLLVSIPGAYVPTLFVVYLISITILLGYLYLKNRNKKSFNTLIKIYLITFLINAFWLLPFIFFILTSSDININSKINQMATETIFLQNKEFGNILDVVLLKGFWFNNIDPNLQGNFTYMFSAWKVHLLNPFIQALGHVIFGLILLGVIVAALKEKKPIYTAFIILFVFSFTMLATATPPFSWIDNIARTIPLFKQVFRFPFTKFSILTSLTFSVFLAFGASYLSGWIKKIPAFVIPVSLILVFTFPIFQGKLLYEKGRLKIPNEYNNLIEYFKNQDQNTRIANLPQYTFWGWGYYDWGYGGSGFLWYGIRQPMLDRAFDVWSPANENYYWELSQAIYKKDARSFINVLNKYQVSWLILDENVINPAAPKALFYPQLKSLIDDSISIEKAEQFGKIGVYKVKLKDNQNSFIFETEKIPSVNSYKWSSNDKAYVNLGNYISENNSRTLNYFYPFRSLFSGRNEEDRGFEVIEHESKIDIQTSLDDFKSASLDTSSFFNAETIIATEFFAQKNFDKTVTVYAEISTPEIFVKRGENESKIWGRRIKYPIFILGKDTIYPVKINLNGYVDFNIKDENSKFLGSTGLSLTEDNIFVLTDGHDQPVFFKLTAQDIKKMFNDLPKFVKINDTKKGDKFKVKLVRIDDGYQGFRVQPSEEIVKQVYNCDSFRRGETEASLETNNENKLIKLTSRNATACMSYYSSTSDHDLGYVVFVQNRNIKARPLHFWILNENEKISLIDTYLKDNNKLTTSYFIIPPQEKFGKSYSLHFDNISIGNDDTINELGTFSLSPIPYNFLKNLRLEVDPFTPTEKGDFVIEDVSHPNESLYVVKINPERVQNKTIVLSQAYDRGWMAYRVKDDPSLLQLALPFVFGKKLGDHVIVNNWENGWILDQSSIINHQSSIIIVYLPQYLQYVGFILSLFTLIFVIFRTFKNGKKKLTHNNLSDRLSEYTNSAPDETLIAP